jgi:DNA-binding MarR family transcriptional regulator
MMNRQETRALTDKILRLPMLFRSAVWRSERMPKTNLTHMQMMVMGAAYRAKILNMTELGGAVSVSSQQITRIVDELVHKGFLQREGDPTNRRIVLVRLTAEGVARMERHIDAITAVFFEEVTAMKQEDALGLQKSVDNLCDILERLAKSKG